MCREVVDLAHADYQFPSRVGFRNHGGAVDTEIVGSSRPARAQAQNPINNIPLAAIAVFLVGVGAAPTAAAELAANTRWYIGFGFGISPNAQYEGQGARRDFKGFDGDGSAVGVYRFKAGGKIGNKHLIGTDLGAVLAIGNYYLMMSHIMAAYTYYPRAGGFFVRTGIGEGNLSETIYDSYGYGIRTHYSSWGAAALFGVGYSSPVRGRFNISFNLDHEIQRYKSRRSDMDSASATQMYVTFDWN